MTDLPAGEPAETPAAPAPPTSPALARLDPHGWRTTVIVAAIMLATVFGANLVNAAVPLPASLGTVDPGPEVPVGPGTDPSQPAAPPVEPGPVVPGTGLDVGYGVVVYPPDGWTVVGSESGQAILQKGGALILVLGTPWTTSAVDLVVAYRDAFFEDGQLTANEPQSFEIGDGIPAAGFQYAGILAGSQVDGAMIAGTAEGSGVVVNVVVAAGGLEGVSDDVDHLLDTIQIGGVQP